MPIESFRLGENMVDQVTAHYAGGGSLANAIADSLRNSGKDLDELKTTDLATVDEFHIRGRKATLELAEQMKLSGDARILDIGSGLGGPARTLAETYGCHVTGIDLTEAFCEAAKVSMPFSSPLVAATARPMLRVSFSSIRRRGERVSARYTGYLKGMRSATCEVLSRASCV